jgi:Tfp pilus assembly protein PilN
MHFTGRELQASILPGKGMNLATLQSMEKRKLSPEMRFTILLFLITILLVLGIMNKWF